MNGKVCIVPLFNRKKRKRGREKWGREMGGWKEKKRVRKKQEDKNGDK